MGTAWQDIKFGTRMLVKRPGFTLTVVLLLALGIGPNTALFSVINSVLLSPLPFPEAHRIVFLGPEWNGLRSSTSSGPDYLDWTERNTVFESMCAIEFCRLNLTGASEPLALKGLRTTSSFFPTIQPKMALGQGFRPDASQRGNPYVTVLTHGLWRDRFDSDPNIVGRIVTLDNTPYTVVGVAAPLMGFIEDMAQIFIPLQESQLAQTNRGIHQLIVLGRLKPDVFCAQALAQMKQVTAQLAKEYPDTNNDKGIHLEPLHKILIASIRTAFLVLYGAVILLLVIACVNVSNLLVAKAATRRHEMAIRRSMGAGRIRIIRQLLTESLLLGLMGGALGLVLAFWGLDLLQLIAPRIQETSGSGIPGFAEIRLNLPILGFTLVLSVIASLAFGILPAWQGSRFGLVNTLRETGRRASHAQTRHRTLGMLIVGQIALALILLTSAGLLIRSFVRIQQSHPGFDARDLLALHVVRPNTSSQHDCAAFFQQALEELEALPGVQAVGAVDIAPMSPINWNDEVNVVGKPGWQTAETRRVSKGYFHCLDIPLVQGRAFAAQDEQSGQSVAIVNQEFVRRRFPDRDPIGQEIIFWGRRWTIVGVVGNVRLRTLHSEEFSPFVYVPLAQAAQHGMTLFLRTTGDPVQWAGPTRRALREIDPSQPILSITTMHQLVQDSISVERFCMILLNIMAGVALLMALVGLYGVMTFSVSERCNEIGIRKALGAEAGDILILVLKKAFILTLLGLGVGLVGALAITRLMSSMLYRTSIYDPATFVLIPALLFTVAILACYIPARRAARIDPMEALRYE
ncbi:MAG: ABC transporter permease [Sedimentisphaerales bacterium]